MGSENQAMAIPELEEYYSGCIYQEGESPLYWVLKSYLSRVELNPENVCKVQELAKRDVVVYVLKNRSQLDCMILENLSRRKDIPHPVYCHGINMLIWQPVEKALRYFSRNIFSLTSGKNDILDEHGFLKKLIGLGKSCIIHLVGFKQNLNQDPIAQLILAQRELKVSVYLVPVLVSYGPRWGKRGQPIMDVLFGQRDNPGRLRRLLTFLQYHRRTAVTLSDPVNLADYLAGKESQAVGSISQDLMKELINGLEVEKQATLRPVLKPRREIIEMTLKDPDLVRYMSDWAVSSKEDQESVQKEAKEYLEEIAADYNEFYIEIWSRVLTWLWNDIYDGVVVDKHGLTRIRELSKKMPLVVIPCHRSHIDYLLLSYVFDQHNIPLPFVAAGSNLMFWPLGHIFRKSGAFFIRRTFGGNLFYRETLARYLKIILKEGYPIEFFIEGGRSRTGKMVMPKYGLLSMVVQSYNEGIRDDMAIIPVFIGYDRVMEEKSYLEELSGSQKRRENAALILKSHKLLNKRYGSVYVNIGEPITLKSYLASEEKAFAIMATEERQSFYRKIGYDVVVEISKVSVVTPFALVAAGLLCHCKRGVSHEELVTILKDFYEFLVFEKVRFAHTFAHREKAVSDALDQCVSLGIISRTGVEGEDGGVGEIIYSLPDDKRLQLEYYKNNILHFFLSISFVATSILSSGEEHVPLFRIMEDYKYLKYLFRHEFIFDQKKDDADEIHEILSYLYGEEMISGVARDDEAWIEIKGKGRTKLKPFAGLIHNYIESYWIVLMGCSHLEEQMRTDKDFLKMVQRLGNRMFKKGDILRAEALSQSNFQNAIEALMESDVVLKVEEKDKKDRMDRFYYALTEDRSLIESLRQKLFRFL
jgi:glycerol-3-phosphate O-acyltransferase